MEKIYILFRQVEILLAEPEVELFGAQMKEPLSVAAKETRGVARVRVRNPNARIIDFNVGLIMNFYSLSARL